MVDNRNKLDTQPVHEDKPTEQELMNEAPKAASSKSPRK
jgi:hypothetical protein